MAKKQQSKKQVIALTDDEHVLHRPTMYIGSIEPTEDKIPIVRDGQLVNVSKRISVGFYKMMNEILDNSFDEAKRLKGKMKKIEVHFDSKTNRVTVKDYGEGFYNGTKINEKTGISNIETAMTELRAGTNFFNDDSDDALIGTNGVGASLVNMLSSEFLIETCNPQMYFKKSWKEFSSAETIQRKKKRGEKTGTSISFVPRETATVHGKTVKLFTGCSWDKEYVQTLMIFRQYLKKNDGVISDLEFEAYFDGKKLDIDIDFLPKDTVTVKTKLGVFVFWRHHHDATSVSFVNGAQCTGIHQKIFNDWINGMFDYHLAHHFYETLVLLNLPPKLVRFADQNKTKYAGGRWEIEGMIKRDFYKKVYRDVKKSGIFKGIKQSIDERLFNENVRKIERKKKVAKKKVSDKYFAPSQTKDTLFIVEGNSARGSILQKRNPKSDGVYTLKGKIKNAKKITDLSNNNEIIDLMTILGLKAREKTKCTYSKVVIATDWDPDGIGHIASLLINLFYRWFPHIIEEGKLHILITPLVSVEVKGKKNYFYAMGDFRKFEKTGAAYGKVRYLKGLGSLSRDDWEWVMAQRRMFRIYNDRSAKRFIDIAFGASSESRKKWLQST
jgi:DNA gyrase/topoisomerase IV subunit B